MDSHTSSAAAWYAELLTALERFALKRRIQQDRAREFAVYITSEVYLQEPDAPDAHAFVVNPERFARYCWQLAKFRVNNGEWYPRPGERSLDAPDTSMDNEGSSSLDPADPQSQKQSDAVDNLDLYEVYIRKIEAARPLLDSDDEREVLDRWVKSLKDRDGKSLRAISKDMKIEGYCQADGSPYPPNHACTVATKIMSLVGR